MSLRTTLFLIAASFAGAVSSEGIVDYPAAAPDGSTFRSDYRFHQEADGWLKLHRVPKKWHEARRRCFLEGARLASPVSGGLSSALRMFLYEVGVSSIFTGVHLRDIGDDYYSVEGVHMTEMPLEWAEGEPDNSGDAERCLAMLQAGLVADVDCADRRPYVCYREKVGTMAMNECGNYDKGYAKNARTGSCYKYHTAPSTWAQANAVCSAEGGHLAIINSDNEAELLRGMALGKQSSAFIHIGFADWYKDDKQDFGNHWTTLDDKSLEDAGFSQWCGGQPDNFNSAEHCGSLLVKDGVKACLNDLGCQGKVPFVCEIDNVRRPLWQ